MKKLVAAGLVLVGLLAFAGGADAHGRKGGCNRSCGGEMYCGAPAVAVSYAEQAVTAYRPVWKTREVNATVYQPVTREVVQNYQAKVLVPEYSTVERTATVYK